MGNKAATGDLLKYENMKDKFGRQINYLRVSLTDRCNLRCVYCMPTGEISFMPAQDLLTIDELEKIVRAAADVGFKKVRLTGGEPTLRKDIVEIVKRLVTIEGISEISMTTNGYRLPSLAPNLAKAGLKRVNIHIDSLDSHTLPKIMQRSNLERVWAGIEAAEQAGLTPIKLNTVVARGYNENSAIELARLTLEKSWQIRFIELMPFAGPTEVQLDHFVSSNEIKQGIEREIGPLFPVNQGQLDGEARVYRVAGSMGTLGFISPISNPYCDNCNRLRLTADGRLRTCLMADQEINLLRVLRQGGTHNHLRSAFACAIFAKPKGHALNRGIWPKSRMMSQIGG